MSVRVLYDSDEKIAALYCSTTDHAFGPIFNDDPKSEWSAAESCRGGFRRGGLRA